MVIISVAISSSNRVWSCREASDSSVESRCKREAATKREKAKQGTKEEQLKEKAQGEEASQQHRRHGPTANLLSTSRQPRITQLSSQTTQGVQPAVAAPEQNLKPKQLKKEQSSRPKKQRSDTAGCKKMQTSYHWWPAEQVQHQCWEPPNQENGEDQTAPRRGLGGNSQQSSARKCRTHFCDLQGSHPWIHPCRAKVTTEEDGSQAQVGQHLRQSRQSSSQPPTSTDSHKHPTVFGQQPQQSYLGRTLQSLCALPLRPQPRQRSRMNSSKSGTSAATISQSKAAWSPLVAKLIMALILCMTGRAFAAESAEMQTAKGPSAGSQMEKYN